MKLRSIWEILWDVGRHGSVWERCCVGRAGVQASQETVAEAMVKRPRGGSRDDGILGDPCFGRGVSTEGEYTERKLRDDPQGV